MPAGDRLAGKKRRIDRTDVCGVRVHLAGSAKMARAIVSQNIIKYRILRP